MFFDLTSRNPKSIPSSVCREFRFRRQLETQNSGADFDPIDGYFLFHIARKNFDPAEFIRKKSSLYNSRRLAKVIGIQMKNQRLGITSMAIF